MKSIEKISDLISFPSPSCSFFSSVGSPQKTSLGSGGGSREEEEEEVARAEGEGGGEKFLGGRERVREDEG